MFNFQGVSALPNDHFAFGFEVFRKIWQKYVVDENLHTFSNKLEILDHSPKLSDTSKSNLQIHT